MSAQKRSRSKSPVKGKRSRSRSRSPPNKHTKEIDPPTKPVRDVAGKLAELYAKRREASIVVKEAQEALAKATQNLKSLMNHTTAYAAMGWHEPPEGLSLFPSMSCLTIACMLDHVWAKGQRVWYYYPHGIDKEPIPEFETVIKVIGTQELWTDGTVSRNCEVVCKSDSGIETRSAGSSWLTIYGPDGVHLNT